LIRLPVIQILLERWDRVKGSIRDVTDLAPYTESYEFGKSLDNPGGTAVLQLWPQIANEVNAIDFIAMMDVIRIYEFGTLKFQGYITQSGFTGYISRDGKPNRAVGVTVSSFGSILSSTAMGTNIGLLTGNDTAFRTASKELTASISSDLKNGVSYANLIKDAVSNWFGLVTKIGATNFRTWIDYYLDFSSGLESEKTSNLPRILQFYTGTEQSISLWEILQQLVESPLNEMWFDEGPRQVSVDGVNTKLPSDKSCLVFRSTPFNGTVDDANPSGGAAFNLLPTVELDLDHLYRFDLGRNVQQAYSVFLPISATYDYASPLRTLMGQPTVDQVNLNKYLYRPLIVQLFYTRTQAVAATSADPKYNDIDPTIANVSETLKNWFQHNDQYLAGVLAMMVPADSAKDPRIGDKVHAESIDGHFYVESLLHRWQYQGALESYVTVTRGWNYKTDSQMMLVDRIFKRSVTQW